MSPRPSCDDSRVSATGANLIDGACPARSTGSTGRWSGASASPCGTPAWAATASRARMNALLIDRFHARRRGERVAPVDPEEPRNTALVLAPGDVDVQVHAINALDFQGPRLP